MIMQKEIEYSDFAKHFQQIGYFIQTRAKIKLALNAKADTSNPEYDRLLLDLFMTLAEQLNEGHTVLVINPVQQQILDDWREKNWVYVLDNQRDINIEQPIIIKILENQWIVWLNRQWFAENQLTNQLLAIAQRSIPILDLPQNTKTNQQQTLAIKKACHYALSIITGGPGTGKTYTVAQLVIALQQAHQQRQVKNPYLPPLSIALTAPTGKAAQRMQESLLKSLSGENITLDNAKTLHRLLRIGTDGTPYYHKDNPLPDDLIIVDETSMLGLELASLLVDAIKPTGRLILLGDANQLSAVDAGSVLSDLCRVKSLQPYHTELQISQRFNDNSPIGQLASLIKSPINNDDEIQQKFKKILGLLQTNDIAFYLCSLNNHFQNIYKNIIQPFKEYFDLTLAWLQQPPDIYQPSIRQQLFNVFDTYRILSAGHHGKLGVTLLNMMIVEQHKKLLTTRSDNYFYHGLPVMIQKNDYQLELFNGDVGICLFVQGQMKVCFTDKVIDASRLNIESCQPAYAMTIHKSQGSEFNHVAICLDELHKRLLSQELFYTAVTRSKSKLTIYSTEKILKDTISQKGNRQTGLMLQFA